MHNRLVSVVGRRQQAHPRVKRILGASYAANLDGGIKILWALPRFNGGVVQSSFSASTTGAVGSPA